MLTINSKPLEFKRTGKITMRCEPYLIIKFITHYMALYGNPAEREIIGKYPTANDAKAACEAHRQKNTANE
jgi:hypothetical protein